VHFKCLRVQKSSITNPLCFFCSDRDAIMEIWRELHVQVPFQMKIEFNCFHCLRYKLFISAQICAQHLFLKIRSHLYHRKLCSAKFRIVQWCDNVKQKQQLLFPRKYCSFVIQIQLHQILMQQTFEQKSIKISRKESIK
jgi:hypothetical protein